MKHVVLDNYMVSNVDGSRGSGEYWDFLGGITTMSCDAPVLPKGVARPGFLHAASHFKGCTMGDQVEYVYEAAAAFGRRGRLILTRCL